MTFELTLSGDGNSLSGPFTSGDPSYYYLPQGPVDLSDGNSFYLERVE
jgi:hypothetical protein